MSFPLKLRPDDLISNPTPLRFEKGAATEESIQRLFATLTEAVAQINGKLGLGRREDGACAGNLSGQWRLMTSPAVAGTEFPVAHGLGRIPRIFIANCDDAAGVVYASRRTMWTSELLYLCCSTGSTPITLLIL